MVGPARHFLARGDLRERPVDGTVQVEQERLLVRVDRFRHGDCLPLQGPPRSPIATCAQTIFRIVIEGKIDAKATSIRSLGSVLFAKATMAGLPAVPDATPKRSSVESLKP